MSTNRHKPFAAWDRIRVRGEFALLPPLVDRPIARCGIRTGFYERCAGAAADPDELRRLAAEHQARLSHWSSPPRQRRIGRLGLNLLRADAEAGFALLFVLAAGIVVMAARLPLPLVLAGVLGMGAVAITAARHNRAVDLRLALRNQRCPDCDHPLSGSSPGVPLASLDGLDVGPSRCPECGAPWPLVPPWLPETKLHVVNTAKAKRPPETALVGQCHAKGTHP